MSYEEIKVYTIEELLALEVEAEACSAKGCQEEAKKICGRCKGTPYCAHHYWRHVDQSHPAMSRETGGEDRKGQH